jgi:hypothetical protein
MVFSIISQLYAVHFLRHSFLRSILIPHCYVHLDFIGHHSVFLSKLLCEFLVFRRVWYMLYQTHLPPSVSYRTLRVFKWNNNRFFLTSWKDISLFLFVSAVCRYHYAELLNILKQLKTHVYVCCEFVASFLFFLVHKCVLSPAGKCLLLLHICYCWSKSMCFET